MSDDKKMYPKSQKYKAERSSDEWEKYQKSTPEEKKKQDVEYKKREDAECQEPGCSKEALHHDKRENKSGRCIEHWDGSSDDNG